MNLDLRISLVFVPQSTDTDRVKKVIFFSIFLNLISLCSSVAQVPTIEYFWFHKNQNSFDTGIQRLTFPPAESSEVLISLIDSGVDLAHPYLQDVLSRKADWDFSRADGQSKVSDEKGDGTHAAGVVASFAKSAASSVFKKLKVLPLKVSREKGAPFDQQLILAVDYSVSMGAKVILLNESWSERDHSAGLKSSLDRARSAGVAIVSPSGDYSHQRASYPCLLDNVICVGSSDRDGRTSALSNKNFSIDFLAPGQNILSAVPMNMKTTSGFKNFDYKSGSKSSAAIIGSMIATMVAIYPRLGFDEVYHRLAFAAKDRASTDSINGFPVFEKAILPPAKDYPVVALKNKNSFQLSSSSLNFEFNILNLGSHANRVVVDYSTTTPGVSLLKVKDTLSFQNGERSQKVLVPVSIKDVLGNQKIELSVKLTYYGASKTSLLSGMVRGELSGQKIGELSGNGLKDQRIIAGGTETYYTTLSELNVLTMYRVRNGLEKLGSANFDLDVMKAIDIDDDKIDEFFAVSQASHKEKVITYFDQSLRPKLTGAYIPESASFDKQDLRFIPYNFEGKKIKVPLFTSRGSVTKADTQPGDFSMVDPDRHVYWLEPRKENGKVLFVTRTLTHERFREKVLSTLSVNLSSHLDIMLSTKRSDTIQILAGVKDPEGITQSGVSIEMSSLTATPKVKSIGFDRPLGENGLLLPIEGPKGITSDGDILFIASPRASKLSLYSIGGMSGPVQSMSALGDLEVSDTDAFIDVPLIYKEGTSVESWLRSKQSLILLNSDKSNDIYPTLHFERVERVKGKQSGLLVPQGKGVSFIKRSGNKILAPIKWSLAPEGCLYVGNNQSSIFFSCSRLQTSQLVKVPLE